MTKEAEGNAQEKDLPDGLSADPKADGYRYMIVNGQITFEDNVCTSALPGKLLRSTINP